MLQREMCETVYTQNMETSTWTLSNPIMILWWFSNLGCASESSTPELHCQDSDVIGWYPGV